MAFEILTSNQGILETRMGEASLKTSWIVIHPKTHCYETWPLVYQNLHTYIYVNPLVIGNERILSPSLLVYCVFCFLLRAIDNKLEGVIEVNPKSSPTNWTHPVCVQDQESMRLIFLSRSSSKSILFPSPFSLPGEKQGSEITKSKHNNLIKAHQPLIN